MQKRDAKLLTMREFTSPVSFSCCFEVTWGHSLQQKGVNWLLALLNLVSMGLIWLGRCFIWFAAKSSTMLLESTLGVTAD